MTIHEAHPRIEREYEWSNVLEDLLCIILDGLIQLTVNSQQTLNALVHQQVDTIQSTQLLVLHHGLIEQLLRVVGLGHQVTY